MAECSLDNCNEECFEDNDKCILHCEKDNEWEKKNDNNVMFQNKIQRYIQALSYHIHPPREKTRTEMQKA